MADKRPSPGAKPRRPQVRWTPHRDQYEVARAAFSVAYMSNAKWYKALRAIAQAHLHLELAEWKFIDSDLISALGVPRERDLLPRRLADGRYQPVEYKWIERIRFPRAYHPKPGVGLVVEQDLDGLRRVLAEVGQFYIEEDDRQVTLFGYGR